MYRILSFLTKRDGMSMSSFKQYYENHHVPLILSLAPSPLIYKRRYLDRDEKLTETGASVDFDVVTELVFPDQEAFHSWMTKLGASENDGKVAVDEARFLDRARTRAYVIDEHVTAG
jgi:uncharacterized protein (TIGR02118 family)